MSPRPRTVSDEDILAATARAIGRVGPVDLTLAHVAHDVGISPATLVQRFGSKRNLLLTLARSASTGTGDCFARFRAQHPSPLEALLASLTAFAQMMGKPAEISNHLAFLQIDLTDPDFHRLAQKQAKATTVAIEQLLREAITAGELARCDVAQLARTLQAVMSGSLLSWAIVRGGRPDAWLRRDLEAIVAPYRASKRKTGTLRRR